MIGIAMLSAALLAPVNPASTAAAEPPATTHQQHQATGQHQRAAHSDVRCCCEEMMHKMMTDMQMHHGMGTTPPGTVETPPQAQDQK